MAPRLKSEIWVKAYLRRCQSEDVMAVVVRRGDDSAGGIFIKINRLDGTCAVLAPTVSDEGGRAWFLATGKDLVNEDIADAYLQRQRNSDPDIWVIEVEDRQGLYRVDEPIRV